jgi:hypothetical protein
LSQNSAAAVAVITDSRAAPIRESTVRFILTFLSGESGESEESGMGRNPGTRYWFRSITNYDSIADAVADLGRPEEIGKVFAG